MFEQSLYDQEPIREPQGETPVEPLQEGDLFGTYELKSWSLSPRLYKILGASAAVNILALLIFAQTSVLTMKGCDSPLVGSVCQVLDTVYVGAMLFGTEREYADVAYEKTELKDADITYIELAPESEKLYYPSNYFQIANPVEYQAQLDAMNNEGLPPGYIAPGIPGNAGMPAGYPPPHTSGSSIFDTPARIPKRNNNVIDLNKLPKDIDDNSVAGANPTTKVKQPKGNKPAADVPRVDANGDVPGFPGLKPTPDPNAQAGTEPKDEAKPDQFGIFINKRPIKDKAKETIAQVDANEIKLDTSFKVTVSGTLGLGKDGKTIILKNPQKVAPDPGTKNDPKMEKLVQEWIVAVGDAGWFGYLERLNENKKVKDKKVLITVEQNEADFAVSISSEESDANVAKSLSSSLGLLLAGAGQASSGDEQMFIKAANSTSEGKSLILKIRLTTPQVQDMIQRKLAEEKAKSDKPNGNALVRPSNNTGDK